jgi:putative membrane protein
MPVSSESLKIVEQLLQLDIMHWVTQTVAMALTALLLPNLRVTSIFGPVMAVVALAVVNTTIWSTDLFSQLPLSASTQALTLLAINGAIFWLVVKLLPGIESKGVLPVVVAPIVFTVCTMVIPQVTARVNWGIVRSEATRLFSEARQFVEKQSGASDGSDKKS